MRWHAEAWRLFFLDHGIALDIPEFLAKTAGMPTQAVLSYYLRRRIPAAEGRRLALRKERIYRDLYRPHLRPAPGLRDFLRGARRAGILLGVGTGSRGANVGFVLDGLSLRRRFDAVVTGAQVLRGKPHPETFLRLARRLGAPPRRCLVFEDALLGEKAACRAGMKIVALTTSHPAAEFRRAALTLKDFRGFGWRDALRLLP